MGEKKVEHIELFYDLIFVFCISKLTAFLEPMTERFDDFSPLPYYLLMFMILLQIWILTTFLMNRYGYRHATDYACIFINMFFLFFMADGIREDWTNDTFLRFHVAWALIMLNLALQFGYKLHRHECMDKLDEKIIKRYMAILLTEGTLAALCIPVFLSTGKLLAIIPLAVGIGLVAWSAPLFGKRPVHFDHLAERISLLVVITFGEMVVGITGYFTTSSKPFFGMMVFLVVFGLFLIYVFDYYNYLDREIKTSGIGYTLLNIPLIFGANNITMALEAMLTSEAGTLPKTVYLVISMLIYMAGLWGLAAYHKPEFQFKNAKKPWLGYSIIGVFALGCALMLVLHDRPAIGAAITVVMVFGILLLIWRFFKANAKEQRVAAFCEWRPPYQE